MGAIERASWAGRGARRMLRAGSCPLENRELHGFAIPRIRNECSFRDLVNRVGPPPTHGSSN
jgi:hypothetical protein